MLSPRRIYRWTPHGVEAAHPEFPERFSVLLLPSLQNMTGDELRHIAGVIDAGRAASVVWVEDE